MLTDFERALKAMWQGDWSMESWGDLSEDTHAVAVIEIDGGEGELFCGADEADLLAAVIERPKGYYVAVFNDLGDVTVMESWPPTATVPARRWAREVAEHYGLA